MKRAVVPVVLLGAAIVLLYALGRPPSRYVVQEDARARQMARREQYYLLTREIARAALARADTAPLKAKLDAAMFAPREARLGGWIVLFLPPGALASSSGTAGRAGWMEWGEIEPWEPIDPRELQGTWEIRMKPVTVAARLVASLGFGP